MGKFFTATQLAFAAQISKRKVHLPIDSCLLAGAGFLTPTIALAGTFCGRNKIHIRSQSWRLRLTQEAILADASPLYFLRSTTRNGGEMLRRVSSFMPNEVGRFSKGTTLKGGVARVVNQHPVMTTGEIPPKECVIFIVPNNSLLQPASCALMDLRR
jgi:hypothetical protein